MKKFIGYTSLALTGALMAASVANAALVPNGYGPGSSFDFVRQAAVTVKIPAILLDTVASDLNFGEVIRPTAAGSPKHIAIDTDGSIVGAETTIDYTNAVPRTGGDYTFTGDETQTVSITIAADGTPPTGLALVDFTGVYDGGTPFSGATASSGAGQVAVGGGKSLLVGAKLAVSNTAATGAQTVGYKITFTYD